jgi:hypothetical protein
MAMAPHRLKLGGGLRVVGKMHLLLRITFLTRLAQGSSRHFEMDWDFSHIFNNSFLTYSLLSREGFISRHPRLHFLAALCAIYPKG